MSCVLRPGNSRTATLKLPRAAWVCGQEQGAYIYSSQSASRSGRCESILMMILARAEYVGKRILPNLRGLDCIHQKLYLISLLKALNWRTSCIHLNNAAE